MDRETRAEYDNVLRRVVLRNGEVVRKDETEFSWRDWEASVHLRSNCRLYSDETPVESQWTEFQGTFHEGDDSEHGIDLPGVSCTCGKIKNRIMRLHTDMQGVAELVFGTMYTELRERIDRIERREI